jgi:phosphoserine phosphatase
MKGYDKQSVMTRRQPMRRKVALLDWDGTLRDGFLLRDWANYLQAESIISSIRLEAYFRTVHAYLQGAISYDVFTNEAPAAYARALRGASPALLKDAAQKFTSEDLTYGKIFPFTIPLLDQLAHFHIESIVVSGSPQELLETYMKPLGVSAIIALSLEVEGDIYSGDIKGNPATFDAKLAIASQFEPEDVVLAMGDTEADAPLLTRAASRIVVGDQLLDCATEPTLRIPSNYVFSPDDRKALFSFLTKHLGKVD